jgi:hypothetical protein
MNTAFKSIVTISAFSLAAGLMLHASAFAGDAASPNGSGIKLALPSGGTANEVLQNSNLATVRWTGKLLTHDGSNKGFNLVFTQYLNCSNAAGCEYENDAMIEVGNDTSGLAHNRWAICPQIDGVPLDPPCPYESPVPSGEFYVTRSSIEINHAGFGAHKLQHLLVLLRSIGGVCPNVA